MRLLIFTSDCQLQESIHLVGPDGSLQHRLDVFLFTPRTTKNGNLKEGPEGQARFQVVHNTTVPDSRLPRGFRQQAVGSRFSIPLQTEIQPDDAIEEWLKEHRLPASNGQEETLGDQIWSVMESLHHRAVNKGWIRFSKSPEGNPAGPEFR